MVTRFAALVAAATALVWLSCAAGHAGVVSDFWVESHAGADNERTGDLWDASSSSPEGVAESIWKDLSAARAEFGAARAWCTSSLADGAYYTYSYGDAKWVDTVTIWDPGSPVGELLPLVLRFDHSGLMGVYETGVRPADTVTEGRSAVTADITSNVLGFYAHGYNMMSSSSFAGDILRLSGTWDLAGELSPDGTEYIYEGSIFLGLSVPNGVQFDVVSRISVATGVSLEYTGDATFGGLGGYALTAVSDFGHSLILNGFTDESGVDIEALGYSIWSTGPTYGPPPQVIPEPSSMALVLAGFCVLILASRVLRRRVAAA